MTVNAASRWHAADHAASAAFVPALGEPVVALLAPAPGERILDIGCGDGLLMERLGAAGTEVAGIAAAVEQRCASLRRPDGMWEADYVRPCFSMRKPN